MKIKLTLIGLLLLMPSLGKAQTYSLPQTYALLNLKPIMPNVKLTPGDSLPNITEKDICTSGYAEKVRSVTESEKLKVYKEYNLELHTRYCKPAGCEIDHLIPLELGGSNKITNLWPQPYAPSPGAREKDVLENWLHKQVCSNKMSLKQAQILIATDWWLEYNIMLGPDKIYTTQDKPK